jgi:hypothetical protein
MHGLFTLEHVPIHSMRYDGFENGAVNQMPASLKLPPLIDVPTAPQNGITSMLETY